MPIAGARKPDGAFISLPNGWVALTYKVLNDGEESRQRSGKSIGFHAVKGCGHQRQTVPRLQEIGDERRVRPCLQWKTLSTICAKFRLCQLWPAADMPAYELMSEMVESRMGAVAWAMRQRSVSHPRSSNRTCGFPASGSPTGFTIRHTEQIIDRKRHHAA
jgi:hypothetical protein